jgi:TolB-like protein
MERRLAAILAADVVSYSRLMGADEVGTLARLNKLRKERIEPVIADHRGRVFKLMGDGILVEFASVVDAVNCAVAWQVGAAKESLRFRIGINLGDVMFEDGDIFGNGVNVAARLEALADPGGICLSGNVHDEVRAKLDFSFEDMGSQTVKNIAEPVRAYRVVMDTPAQAEAPRPVPRPSEKLGVAVLPLNSMSSDATQDAFAEGITEDIITALSRSYVFDVTARHSTFAYKGKSPDIREVGLALGVNYVLEGSVRQARGRARITVQLIEAKTGNHVWAERYDRTLDDEFAVQDEIAQRVSSILMERIWQDVARTIGQKDRRDYGVFDYLYRGVDLLHRLDPVAMAEAENYFQAALELEPNQFMGHLGMGFCYTTHSFWGDPDEIFLTKAHGHGLHLAQIAPDASQTWRLLSRTYSGMGKWDEAWSCVQRALSLDPNDGDIIGNRGVCHIFHGEPATAIEWLDKVLELHSDTPQTLDIMRYWKALALFTATDFGAAAILLRSVSGHDFIRAELMAACHARLGQIDEARSEAAAALSMYPALRVADIRLWKSFRNEADRQNLVGALRESGLPD